MNVPSGIIETVVVGGVMFAFKVVFGLIGKNEKKSEDEDRRLEVEIKELRGEMREMDERHRQHENDLYNRSSDDREAIAYMKGKQEKWTHEPKTLQ